MEVITNVVIIHYWAFLKKVFFVNEFGLALSGDVTAPFKSIRIDSSSDLINADSLIDLTGRFSCWWLTAALCDDVIVRLIRVAIEFD